MSVRGASSSGAEGLPSARLALPATPSSPGRARAFARETLRAWDLEQVEDAVVLLVSELATNVVLHARCDYDVVLERRADVVRVTVLDDAPGGPVRRRTGLRAATGRGLALVDTLARDWGRTEAPGLLGRAKGIWCDVPLVADELDEGAIYGTDWLAQLED